jgi:hypothetical protein
MRWERPHSQSGCFLRRQTALAPAVIQTIRLPACSLLTKLTEPMQFPNSGEIFGYQKAFVLWSSQGKEHRLCILSFMIYKLRYCGKPDILILNS